MEREVAEVEESVKVALEFFIFLSHTCLTFFPPLYPHLPLQQRNGSFFLAIGRGFLGPGEKTGQTFDPRKTNPIISDIKQTPFNKRRVGSCSRSSKKLCFLLVELNFDFSQCIQRRAGVKGRRDATAVSLQLKQRAKIGRKNRQENKCLLGFRV